MRVHQILSGAGPHDAITTEARDFRALFASWGWGGSDFAARVAPGVEDFLALERLAPEAGDVLLLHHSAALPDLGGLLALPQPKLALYHNITPASLLWETAPVVATHCAAGREQLAELVAGADHLAADSAFNATELRALGARDVDVIPLPIHRERLGSPAGEPSGPPRVIFVGRLSPHKRQAELIQVFAAYRDAHASEARLTLVGDPISEEHLRSLHKLAEQVAPGAVSIETGLSRTELAERWRGAHAMLCLSVHEGFCIPLLEAMHFGVPVIARAAGAVPEVLGNAGVLFEERDPAVIAELLHLVLTDAELHGELRARGARRLDAFRPEEAAERLRTAVLSAARSALAGAR